MEKNQLSFGYIKSEGIGTACEQDTYDLIAEQNLIITYQEDVFMRYILLREHQPILFDLKGDLNDIWKIQGAARLIGTTVRTFIVVGDRAIPKLHRIKLTIREKYALPCEFDREHEMSYPNFIHASDDYAQVESDIRALLPKKLSLCQHFNGVHRNTKPVW